MATVGDINGDGLSDFIVGAPSASPGGRMDAGSAFVYSGADGSLLYQKDGAASNDHLGESVAGAGDVNGDGIPDFIVGAPQNGSPPGIAYVYSGADGSLLHQKEGVGETEAAGFGRAVSGAGDVNADGKADFIVGAPSSYPGTVPSIGSVFLYSGATGILLHRWNGESTLDSFGSSVSGGGDVNGDGKPDIIIGAPNADAGPSLQQDGAVYVFSGSNWSTLHKKTGDVAYGGFYLGTSVSTAGDVDGDGKADFIAGAIDGNPGSIGKVGVLRVYSGATGEILLQKNGLTTDDSLGYSVSVAGDVNGDGYSDFLAGMLAGTSSMSGITGRFQVFSGADGSVLYDISGQGANDQLGFAVATAGDVNGDGHSDFISGTPWASVGGVMNSGAAYVFTTSGELGIVPSETVSPYSLDGFSAMHIPRVAATGGRTFTGSGGTALYTWSLVSNNSGGTIDASGSYTAGSTPDVYDTLRVTDSLGRSHDTRILVGPGLTPPMLPRRPTSLRATLVTANQIDLTWTDNATNETGYLVESRTPTNPWSTAATLSAGATSHSLTGLDADKVYLFRVKAFNAAADSAWSPQAMTTLSSPTGLMATAASSSQIDLSWTDQSTAETGFEIELMGGQAGASWISAGTVGANVTVFSATGLTPDSSYIFRVRAVTSVLQSTWSATDTAATPP